jgi:SAM-dependent methyltransferase
VPGYIDTIYNEKIRPVTTYPNELIVHLCERFHIKQGAKILDVGCGRGDFLNAFKAYGLKAYGVDRDPSGAKCAPDVDIQSCDVERSVFPYEDQGFDIVFSKSVIEHLSDAENFMKESYRVLKPGGRIILMTPDWVSTMKIFYDDYTHRQPFTVAGVKDMLDIFGFRETKAELFYQLPVLWRYPLLKIVSRVLQIFVPANSNRKNKFLRWSVELMVLGSGVK